MILDTIRRLTLALNTGWTDEARAAAAVSRKAASASAKAMRTHDQNDHERAAQLHSEAAAAHGALRFRTTGKESTEHDRAYDRHAGMAVYHGQRSPRELKVA